MKSETLLRNKIGADVGKGTNLVMLQFRLPQLNADSEYTTQYRGNGKSNGYDRETFQFLLNRKLFDKINKVSLQSPMGGEERFNYELAKQLSYHYNDFKVTMITQGKRFSICRHPTGFKIIFIPKVPILGFYWHTIIQCIILLIIKTELIQANISNYGNGLAAVLAKKIKPMKILTRVAGIDPPLYEMGKLHKSLLRFIFKNSNVIISLNKTFLYREIRALCPHSNIVVKLHGIHMPRVNVMERGINSQNDIGL